MSRPPSIVYPTGQPGHEIYINSVMGRHPLCRCTWIWRVSRQAFVLKWKCRMCPAFAWHRKIEGG